MKFSVVLSLTFLVFAFAEDVKDEEGVYVLTDKNFDEFVTENDFVLVEFCKYPARLLFWDMEELVSHVEALVIMCIHGGLQHRVLVMPVTATFCFVPDRCLKKRAGVEKPSSKLAVVQVVGTSCDGCKCKLSRLFWLGLLGFFDTGVFTFKEIALVENNMVRFTGYLKVIVKIPGDVASHMPNSQSANKWWPTKY